MSDEPETPDEGNEQVEHEGVGDHPFFRVNDEPMTEVAWAMWAQMRDTFFEHTIVNGSKPPVFEAKVDTCAAGCHCTLYVSDTANDEHYMVQQIPVFLAQMSGWVDFNGNVNPALAVHETRRRQAVLN